MPAGASVKDVAFDLGLTVRRVHQLVDENILPPPSDGVFNADLCRRRYRQYVRGRTAEWTHVYDDAVALAQSSEELIARALEHTSELRDIAAACLAVQALMSDLRFITAVKSNSQSERQLFFAAWSREEARVLAALLARAEELGPQLQG